MILFDKLYLAFYRYSLWNKENHPSGYIHPRFDSILVLSFLTALNFSTFIRLFEVKPLITTRAFDCFLFFVLFAGILALLYERNSKYKMVVVKYQSESVSTLGWSYTIISVLLFYIIYFFKS